MSSTGPVPRAGESARELGRRRRNALDAASRSAASAAIHRRLLELPELQRAATVAGYWPLRTEVDLRDTWAVLHERGVSVHLPRTDPAGSSMGFVPWTPASTMVTNAWGIDEPTGDGVPLGDLDVAVVPCVAIDLEGHRVGMGAGYYDRALGGANELPTRVGVAFGCQVLPAIEPEPWDVPMQVVVTEDRTTRIAT